jgi:lysophospholipase L1-like esterase
MPTSSLPPVLSNVLLPTVLRIVRTAAVVTCCLAASRPTAAAPPLRDGDRVVFLGDTFFEREGQQGFIETALVAAHAPASLTFRNLGWSGDTVWAESRGVFDPAAKGYERMLALIKELAPTVVFIAYGRNESGQGPAGRDAFRTQLAKLCDDVRTAAAGTARQPADIRLVLVTPHPFETANAAARNHDLGSYCEAIRAVATEKQAGLVDLFAALPAPTPSANRRTENGVHLSEQGYAEVAAAFVAACGGTLPADFVTASQAVRRLVVAKNTLFFHRWRPANETYMFLFRKHEQGNNAVEIPQFDPLVEAAEGQVREAARGLR